VNRPSSRRSFLGLAASCAILSAGAQPGANKALRLIVPAPAGGTTDIVARALAEALRSTAGLEVVVDNRPGGVGAIAATAFLSAPGDGSALLLSPNSLVTEVPYTLKPRYDPFADLVPLAEVASSGLVLVAHAGLPLRNLQEMVTYVKAQPGQSAPYASFGNGTISHIKGLQFNEAAGLRLQHVGYRGSPPALQDVLGGQVPFMFDGLATSLPHVKAGKLTALAVTSARRAALLPDVPTFAEAGYAALTQSIALTLFAKPTVPEGKAARLRQQVADALGSPELLATLMANALEVAPRQQDPADLRRALRLEYERTGKVLRSIGYVSVP
jgi:tripartite-type tricarboxylate transporter receptor subunit TctC